MMGIGYVGYVCDADGRNEAGDWAGMLSKFPFTYLGELVGTKGTLLSNTHFAYLLTFVSPA